ncbi:hypothetical protein FSARC_14908 [Fusarium sarcochroum]|uniref:Heterokaryon incompatibility domain-containing protein n=1 Tax=Fusarium sarcochroum TaxID=1208366 RepID=A0A8H4SPU3_9HYPO|nr:hypothetical protein FSARC_14908 [Fusarium sarcochroum]
MIRLLDILPGLPDSPRIETRLFNTNLLSLDSSYEALSYTWGTASSPRELCTIRINGFTHRITPNLYDALVALRLPDRVRTIWVDSICINQGDLKERKEQVMLMSHIYANAEKTVVFLGQSTPATQVLFGFLALPVCELVGCDTCPRNHSQGPWQKPPSEACAEAGFDEQDVIEGFIHLCSLPWWSRVWILQEFTLSKSDPTLHCGRDQISNELFTKNVGRIYSWVDHRKIHSKFIPGCHQCSTFAGNRVVDGQVSSTTRAEEYQDTSEGSLHDDTDCDDVEEMLEKESNTGLEEKEKVLGTRSGWQFDSMSSPGHEWTTWGLHASLTSAVLERRADLFTRLAAYMIALEHWSGMFWHFPHRLKDKYPTLSRNYAIIPSWVPDFTRPMDDKYGEKPADVEAKSLLDSPFIVDHVLLMTGWLVDEIYNVFPLPKNDPFRLLQQLWYVERTFGWAPYDLIDGQCPANLDDGRSKGVPSYPSFSWATAFHASSEEILIVQIIADFIKLDGLSDSFRDGFGLTLPTIKRIFMREREEDGHPACRLYREKYWDREVDFIGICAFDFEGLRSQILHRLLPMTPWQPWRYHRPKYMNEEVENICNPPLFNAVLQMPMVYRTILTAINKDIEDYEEREMRQETVLPLAEFIHDAVMKLVGGHSEVEYHYLGDEIDEFWNPHRYLSPQRSTGNNPNEDDNADDGGRSDSFCYVNYNWGDGPYKQGPHPKYSAVKSSTSSPISNATKNQVNSENSGNISGSSDSGSIESATHIASSISTNSIMHESRTDLSPAQEVIQQSSSDEDSTRSPSREQETRKGWALRPGPSGAATSWRRVEKRTSTRTHFVFRDVCDFLTGREFFLTDGGLMGLTGPGSQGVCDGDDLFILQGMDFPLIGRLEPSEKLGNPKARRKDISTVRMKREIIGSAIVRNIDLKGGRLDQVVFPDGFEPRSGEDTGNFRFK